MTRAAIYVRISKDRAGAGLGVKRQEDDCRALAKRIKATVIGPAYVDNDLSASTGKRRPAYLRLLDDMAAGLVDVVLVWHTDRLHRSPLELETFIATAESRKPAVNVHAVQAGPLDLSTPSGRMVARQLAAVARYEVELKADRQKASNRQAAESGVPRGGGRAFGFEDDKITHRPREAKAVRDAVSGVLAGRSLHEIARTWNASGVLTVNGKEWNATTVRQMLARPRNAGLREYNDEIIGKATWKPLVPEETWRAMVTLLSDPARRNGPGPRPRWLLSGIAMCGYPGCDRTMKGATASAASYQAAANRPIYRCRGGGHLSRDAAALDAFIDRVAIARLSRPDAIELLGDDRAVDVAAMHTEARELRARKDALALEAATGGISPAQMRIINQSIDGQLAALEAEIVSASQGSVLAGLAGREDVEKRWGLLTLERRRGVVDALMTVTVLPVGRTGRPRAGEPEQVPAGVDITWRSPGAPVVRRQRGNRV